MEKDSGIGDTSSLRRRLRELHQELSGLLEVFFERVPLFKGYVYESRRRCGKASCGCATDESKRHPGWFVTSLHGKKRRNRTVSEAEREALLALAGAYRRHRTARARFVALTGEIRDVVDAIEAARLVEPEGGKNEAG